MANNIHFDWLAPLYDRFIRPPDAARIHALLDLPCSGWLLDAAGGTGRMAAQLCPMVEHLVISDLSLPMLRQAELKNSPACSMDHVQSQVEGLPFADGQFARILVVDAFHHFSSQLPALRELARVLQPGGRLLIEEPDIRHWGVKLIALGETLALMNSHFRGPRAMCEMTEAAGLQASAQDDGHGTAWVIGVKEKLQ